MTGDNWVLECGGSENVWVQEDAFRLKHASTGYYLHHTSQVRCGGFPMSRFSFCCLWLIFIYVVVWRGASLNPSLPMVPIFHSTCLPYFPILFLPVHAFCYPLSTCIAVHAHCRCVLWLSPTHNFTTLIAASLFQHEYGRPIAGQKEICAFPHATRYNQWTTEVRVMNV